jgi:DNA-binding Lrp family transcriptional regulator
MITHAYVVARFPDTNSMLPAVEAVKNCPGVLRWDAVEGQHNLVMKVLLDGPELPCAIGTLPGVGHIERFDIETDDEGSAMPDAEACHGYVYLDTEPEARDAVRDAMKADPHVVFCSMTTGECDIVALLRGTSFADLEATIGDRLRAMDGVLRMKHDWVINLSHL